MQTKPNAKNTFNNHSGQPGYLIVRISNDRPRAISTQEIKDVYVSTENQLCVQVAGSTSTYKMNFDLFMEAFLRARQYGETIDLRDVCNLPNTDKLHKFYMDIAMPDSIKDELRQRIRTITPQPFGG